MRDSTLFDVLLWIMRLRRRLCVTGASMLPLLRPGDVVLVDLRAYRKQKPVEGELVVLRHPLQEQVRMVKRITAVLPEQTYVATGDNPESSTDSRTFGPVPLSQIEGRVTCRFGRSGW